MDFTELLHQAHDNILSQKTKALTYSKQLPRVKRLPKCIVNQSAVKAILAGQKDENEERRKKANSIEKSQQTPKTSSDKYTKLQVAPKSQEPTGPSELKKRTPRTSAYHKSSSKTDKSETAKDKHEDRKGSSREKRTSAYHKSSSKTDKSETAKDKHEDRKGSSREKRTPRTSAYHKSSSKTGKSETAKDKHEDRKGSSREKATAVKTEVVAIDSKATTSNSGHLAAKKLKKRKAAPTIDYASLLRVATQNNATGGMKVCEEIAPKLPAPTRPLTKQQHDELKRKKEVFLNIPRSQPELTKQMPEAAQSNNQSSLLVGTKNRPSAQSGENDKQNIREIIKPAMQVRSPSKQKESKMSNFPKKSSEIAVDPKERKKKRPPAPNLGLQMLLELSKKGKEKKKSHHQVLDDDDEEEEEEEEEEEDDMDGFIDDDEAEDDDGDLDGFIDDGEVEEENSYSKHIRDIFGYDKRRFVDDDDDDKNMEADYCSIMREEARSAKIGRMEDLEEQRKEEAELKRKVKQKKAKKIHR